MRTERGDYLEKKSKGKEKDLSIIKSSEIKQKLHTNYLNSPVSWFKQHTLHLKKCTRKNTVKPGRNSLVVQWLGL